VKQELQVQQDKLDIRVKPGQQALPVLQVLQVKQVIQGYLGRPAARGSLEQLAKQALREALALPEKRALLAKQDSLEQQEN
jgi:hypothetical protein